MKAKQPTRPLKIERLSAIYCKLNIGDDVEAEEKTDLVQWDENESTKGDNIFLVAYEEAELIERPFALAAFFRGGYVCHRKNERDSFKRHDLKNFVEVSKEDYSSVNGLRIDTSVNRTSFISDGQYHANCQKLELPYSIKSAKYRAIAGICRTRKAMGLALI